MKELKHSRLLIHHHAVAYSDDSGAIWLPSFIGRWVDALSEHFGGIGMLLHESASHSQIRQDYRIARANVHLVSLGPPGRVWDRIPRMRRIRAVCQSARNAADGLLIRGATPRQFSVWRWVGLRNTAYLLVGSLQAVESVPTGLSLAWRMYLAAARQVRARWFAMLARRAIMLANSPGLVEELHNRFGCQAQFAPTNTISQNEFRPANPRTPSSPLRLLFCGRVVEDKGIREAIQAVVKLRRSGIRCVLDVVGLVAPDFQEQLEDLAESDRNIGTVCFHGPVPYGDALFGYYSRADIFVLPTYHEGFPHVIWEAAAHSCPIVTCGVGGIPALIEHEKHALFVTPRDPDALSEAILRLSQDSVLREKLVLAAHRRATEFTVEACAERLSSILAERWR